MGDISPVTWPPDAPSAATAAAAAAVEDAAAADAIIRIAGVAGAWCPALSPSGDRVAYVTDRSGLPRLEVANLTPEPGGPPLQVSTPDQEVVSVAWSPDGQWLAYLVSPGGLIRSELHAVRPDGTQQRVLAGTDQMATVFAGCWTAMPNTYAFSLADGQGPGADVCLVDVVTGVVRTVVRGGFLAVTSVSRDGRRMIARRGARGRRHLVIADIPDPADHAAGSADQDGAAAALDGPAGGDEYPHTGLRRLLAAEFPDEGTDLAEDGRLRPDGSAVYLRTSAGRERSALGVVDLAADGTPGPCRILAERADADLDSYAILGDDRTAFLVWNVGGSSRVEVRNLAGPGGFDIDLGRRVAPGWSVRPDGRSAVIELTDPTTPRSLYRLDWDEPLRPRRHLGGAGRSPVIGMPAAHLPRAYLARPEPVRYRSLDGVALESWLYRPQTAFGPTPTVVVLHGGPESQERPAFSILIQSLVAAGIAVIAPNVRGSTGYGRSFAALDDRAARESSFQDVPATVRFLVDSGLATPDRVGVHGWSYGGYLALVALNRWPQLFASGSSHAGMSDFAAFFAETEPWMAAASVTEYGDPRRDASMLYGLSPLHRMHEVIAPTLLVHGEQDTNVPVVESVRAHDALRAAGVATELLLLPGEGHTIVGRDARIALAQAVTGWHARWIG